MAKTYAINELQSGRGPDQRAQGSVGSTTVAAAEFDKIGKMTGYGQNTIAT